jgi:hypothetical protein
MNSVALSRCLQRLDQRDDAAECTLPKALFMNKYLRISILTAVLIFCSEYNLAQSKLPVGVAPTALSFDHFPGPVYTLVWRNWNLVDPSRLAKVLGCRESEVAEIAYSMGLPESRPVPPLYKKRLYITLIRRNWHLLP